MLDEVGLLRLRFVGERKCAQAGLELGRVDADREHRLTHRGQAVQVGCREPAQVLKQVGLDAGGAKCPGIATTELHGNVVEKDQPHVRVVEG